MEKEKNSIKVLISEFIETTNKHNKILEMQTESLLNNTINKDCKSKIYEKIKEAEENIDALENNLELNEQKTNKIEEYLKGDGLYSKGLIREINDLTVSINEIRDYIKEKTTEKKFLASLYNVLSGAGGAVVMAIIQHFAK